MVEIPKVVHVLSCGLLLSLGLLCDVVLAEESMAPGDEGKAGHSRRTYGEDNGELSTRQQGVHIIQGDVLRVEGDTYFIKELGGKERKELSFRADATTAKPEKIQAGDRIEAKVDENNLAQSLLPAP